MKKIVLLTSLLFIGIYANAQKSIPGNKSLHHALTTRANAYNLSSFTPSHFYEDKEKLISVNNTTARSNPDFGKVVAPDSKWYEQYDKRTATTRNFITEDGAIVVGTSYNPMNYLDKDGYYRSINPVLSPAENGWAAVNQQYPTYLNKDGSTELTLAENEHLKFNVNNTINGHTLSINSFIVGDNGMMIYNAYDGVDKRIVFKQNAIETDYIINKPIAALTNDLIISEEITLPDGYSIKVKSLDEMFIAGTNHSELEVVNDKGECCVLFKMPLCYDSNKDRSMRLQSFTSGTYILRQRDGRHFLDIVVSASWLNDPQRVYPIIVDPLVTGGVSRYTNTISSCLYPNFGSASINVAIPANITLTNLYVAGSYVAIFPASARDGVFFFNSQCGSTDTLFGIDLPNSDTSITIFIVSAIGDSTPGYADLISELGCCFTPSCSTQTIPITENLARLTNIFGNGCNDTYIAYNLSLESPMAYFQAYARGRTVEIDKNITDWSVTPSTFCSDSCNLLLTTPIQCGVPPYTLSHQWAVDSVVFGSYITTDSCVNISNGTASLNLTIPNCPTTCGTTSSFIIPVPIIKDQCGITAKYSNGTTFTTKSTVKKPAPVVNSVPSISTICSGSTVNITNASCVAGSTITWNGSDGSSGNGNVTDIPLNNGNASITVNYTTNASADGCSGAPVTVRITVNPSPTSYFTLTADSTQLHHYIAVNLATGLTPLTYYWSWGDGTHDTIAYPSHIYADSGFYDICLTVTDLNDCSGTYCDSSFHALRTLNTMVYVDVKNPVTQTIETASNKIIYIYPNPAKNQLAVYSQSALGGAGNDAIIRIYNMLGQEMDCNKSAIPNSQSAITIDISTLPAGIYLLQLRTEIGVVVKKFVKE